MKIAFVGNFQPRYSTENDVVEAFRWLGHDVALLQENGVTADELRSSALASELLLWTSTWDQAQPLLKTRRTLAELADAGIPTATYHLDTFWGLHRDGRQWRENPMFHTRYIFTADGSYEDRWDELFSGSDRQHSWLPAGVRQSACYVGTARPEYVCDVAFVGCDGRNCGYHPEWPYRRQLVDKLEAMCKRNGWSFRNPGGREPKIARDGNMNDFYASAKVTVGDSLCPMHEASLYWSDRVYEATGRGGLVIMPEIDALIVGGPAGVPTYPWGNWAALEDTIASLLEDPDRRIDLRRAGWTDTRTNHTYVHRMAELLSKVTTAHGLSSPTITKELRPD